MTTLPKWGPVLDAWGWAPHIVAKAYENQGSIMGKAEGHAYYRTPVYEMQGSTGGTYQVQVGMDPEEHRLWWARCTCPHGERTGSSRTTCYHTAAVAIRVLDEHWLATRPVAEEGDPGHSGA